MNTLTGIAIIGFLAWILSNDDDNDDNMQKRIDRQKREYASREYWGMKMLNCHSPITPS